MSKSSPYTKSKMLRPGRAASISRYHHAKVYSRNRNTQKHISSYSKDKKMMPFQQAGLRQILKIQPTFINRANTNAFVFAEAQRQSQLSIHSEAAIWPFSHMYLYHKRRLLCQLITNPSLQLRSDTNTAPCFRCSEQRMGIFKIA